MSDSTDSRLTDVCRSEFDMAALTVGPMDSISTVWSVSAWLCDASAYLVSRFDFLGLVGADALNLDLYRCDFDSITLMAGSNDPKQAF